MPALSASYPARPVPASNRLTYVLFGVRIRKVRCGPPGVRPEPTEPRARPRLGLGRPPTEQAPRARNACSVGGRPSRSPWSSSRFRRALGETPGAGRSGTLRIRTPVRTYVSHLLAGSGLAGYEPDTLACFLAAIEERGSGPVFDVGANIGVFSWLAAALTPAIVVAFEPTPDLAAQMRAICAENDLDIRVEELALGAAPGTAELHLSDKTDSSNSLRAGFRPSHRSVSVPGRNVDAYVARTGVTPAVLKVDTELTEPDVLRGATGVLETESALDHLRSPCRPDRN